jgi:hypothetical protein
VSLRTCVCAPARWAAGVGKTRTRSGHITAFIPGPSHPIPSHSARARRARRDALVSLSSSPSPSSKQAGRQRRRTPIVADLLLPTTGTLQLAPPANLFAGRILASRLLQRPTSRCRSTNCALRRQTQRRGSTTRSDGPTKCSMGRGRPRLSSVAAEHVCGKPDI